MNQTFLSVATGCLIGLAPLATIAGSTPVEVLPSAPVVVGPTIDTQAVAVVLAPLASTSPAVQAAVAALAGTTPGSIEALGAVNALGSAMAISIGSGEFAIPDLNASQLAQAISLLDNLAAAIQAAGGNNGGIQALRAALGSRAAALGLIQ